ncbi:MAG: glycoside hydrolase family 97 protein [Bacteroidales bacterium]|nr:glycoside hydrolase family 97 protein [Bacteroidales bacterium]
MKRILLLLAALTGSLLLQAKDYTLKSPDGAVVVTVQTGNHVSYSVERGGLRLLAPSQISMMLLDGTMFGGNDRFRVTRRSVDQRIPARNFKRSSVRDHFNEMTLSAGEYDLVFRAYDDGVAYRFISRDKREEIIVTSEQAEFAFPYDWNVYAPYVAASDASSFKIQYFNSFENTYSHHLLSKWEKGRLAFLPLTVEASNGIKLCITESDLLNYPGMYLYNRDGKSSLRGHFAEYPGQIEQGGHNELQGLVRTRHSYLAKVPGVTEFPWRVMVIATEDRLLAENDLTWRLGRPAADQDWSWVKPGKVAWDWWNDWNLYGVDFEAGINNDTYKYYIDFASEHGIEYVILDEGWAVNKEADLMQVVPEIDLPMLCRYAEQKNVGLILWAGYWAFNRDMEGVCKHYSQMGIKGWKIDFMDRDDQLMVQFYEKAAATAAKYKMLCDFHGAFKPAGIQRTYPNVLNFEGIHGLEQMKWSSASVDQVTYDVTVPFTRLVAGPADYTQGAMRNATRGNYRPVNSEPMSQGTRCHQLAEYIVFDAPLTMLCDSPSNYRQEEECTKFIASVPTVWDETVALDGKIAEYVVMARRSGSTWYVGVLGNWEERDLEIDLSRLGTGDRQADAFVDGINAHRAARDYRHESVPVSGGKWKVHLAPGGGAVLVL